MLANEDIKKLAKKYLDELIQIRRHLHQYPELSFQEFETSKFIQSKLHEAGISFTTGHVKTGIIASIQGNTNKGKTILLRADMDALPIQETNTVPYQSTRQGRMHACGHDVHTACVLGAALILNDTKHLWHGTVKIMFQPGEEVLPGGASLMIEEGVLENPKVDKALALHVHPSMEVGKVGFKAGMYMASTDELYLTVNGKGGHAAMPQNYTNPLLIAANILLDIDAHFMAEGALRGTAGENIPTVVAFGKIDGKGATNVIPAKVEVAGTMRTMDESWRSNIHQQLRDIVKKHSDQYGIESFIRIEKGYPFLVNDANFTLACQIKAAKYLGEDAVEQLPMRMTAEDFAFISQKVPSCFFRLGTGNKEKNISAEVHTSNFDVDEQSIEIGAGLMAALAIEALR
ncbi:MAG: M20 family metallopeptidase [Bacteroidota bacterium]